MIENLDNSVKSITLIITGMYSPKVVFFPDGQPSSIYTYIKLPVGTSAVYTDKVAQEVEKRILTDQFSIMIRRLWLGITWPSAILTIIFGGWIAWISPFFTPVQQWIWIKLGFVAVLYAYHFTLHRIYSDEMKGIFRFSSNQLRIWNEVATILLIAIVMLATVKESISWLWGVIGLVLFTGLLLSGIKIYKMTREKK